MAQQGYDNANYSPSISERRVDNKRLFVGGIGKTITEDELYDYFSQFGEIEEVVIKINQFTGISKGYGFVQFTDAKFVDSVVNFDGQHFIAGKRIDAKRADYDSQLSDINKLNLVNNKRLFVGGIGQTIREHELHDYFSQFGQVIDVIVKFDSFSGLSKGYGFIQFDNAESANKAMQNSYHNIANRNVEVKRAKPKEHFSMYSKMFVGNLTPEMKEHEIINHFNKFGPIAGFFQPYNVAENRKKNFCYVTYKDNKVIGEVLKHPIHMLNGVKLDVKKAKFNKGLFRCPNTVSSTNRNCRRPVDYTTKHYDHVPSSRTFMNFGCTHYNAYAHTQRASNYDYGYFSAQEFGGRYQGKTHYSYHSRPYYQK